jgi:hypothetical protein
MSQEQDQTPVVEETKGTEVEETTKKTADETVKNESSESIDTQEPDYKKKFTESQKEALRLRQEVEDRERELKAFLEKPSETVDTTYGDDSESLYPGFNMLSEEEQKNLVAYTEGIKKKALADLYKDPSIAFAKESYNEREWDSAFNKVTEKFPEIKESADSFKSKYFKKGKEVPSNIQEILTDLAKVHLFDRSRDLGAKDAEAKMANRIDVERQQAGDKSEPKQTSRSLEDWYRLQRSNPAQFAKLSEQFKKDLESGKLK